MVEVEVVEVVEDEVEVEVVDSEGVEEVLATELAEEVVENGKIESGTDSIGLMSAALGRAVINGSLDAIALGGTAGGVPRRFVERRER